MEFFGLTAFGMVGYWFSEIFFRLLIAIIVVLFAYLKFGKTIFLRNTLIVTSIVFGVSFIFIGIYYLMILPRFLMQLLSYLFS